MSKICLLLTRFVCQVFFKKIKNYIFLNILIIYLAPVFKFNNVECIQVKQDSARTNVLKSTIEHIHIYNWSLRTYNIETYRSYSYYKTSDEHHS